MAKSDERLGRIGAAVRGQAEEQRQEILQKTRQERETTLRDWEQGLVDEMYNEVQHTVAELRRQSQGAAARAESESHSALLLRREELMRLLLAGTRTSLIAFAASTDYPGWLVNQLAPWREKLDHTHSVLYLRPEDAKLGLDLLPGAKVEEDATIRPGGFVLENTAAGIRVDETLETRLREQMPWLRSRCALRVREEE